MAVSALPRPIRARCSIPICESRLLLNGDSHADQHGGKRAADKYSAQPVHAGDCTAWMLVMRVVLWFPLRSAILAQPMRWLRNGIYSRDRRLKQSRVAVASGR